MIADVRRHQRLDVEFAVTWSIESQNIAGPGTLLDVSVHGACFRMQQPFTAKAGLVFTLESPDVPTMPKRGRLRWYRKLPGKSPVFLCGVIFEDQKSAEWVGWLENAIASQDKQTA